MLFKRFYDEKLAQASYLIGCGATGEALVVDPNRDVEQYLKAAEVEGLTITHVTETHIHADFVSGARELAQRAAARLYLSDAGGGDWRYRYAADAGAVLLKDGSSFQVGNILVDALHTPGHTPEHLSFLITDRATTDQPVGVLTGDFVFVGDLGRPDLLEKVAGVRGTMESGARQLFQSVQRFKALPQHLQIWPGHGAGSACGKALGAMPQSTLGYERLVNWGFNIQDESEFVQAVLAGQPEPPKYFADMKRINRDGPRSLGGFRRPPRSSLPQLDELLRIRAMIVDTRPADEYGRAHVPGMINIPLTKAFTTWAGWLVPYDTDFYLIIRDECSHCLDEAVKDLAMIGLDQLAGYFGSEVVEAWETSGRKTGSISKTNDAELERLLAEDHLTVVDVRGRTEWDAGHLPGARHIPLGYLIERLDEIDQGVPVAVHCQGGARSAIAASLLQAHGFKQVLDLHGGYAAWIAAGRPTEQAGQLAMPALA